MAALSAVQVRGRRHHVALHVRAHHGVHGRLPALHGLRPHHQARVRAGAQRYPQARHLSLLVNALLLTVLRDRRQLTLGLSLVSRAYTCAVAVLLRARQQILRTDSPVPLPADRPAPSAGHPAVRQRAHHAGALQHLLLLPVRAGLTVLRSNTGRCCTCRAPDAVAPPHEPDPTARQP